jgi:hypothetical protein
MIEGKVGRRFGIAVSTLVALVMIADGLAGLLRPQSVLGAILITGFVGGALAAHLRVTQAVILPEIINVALGVGAWGGLWLRDPRLRTLLPLRYSSHV